MEYIKKLRRCIRSFQQLEGNFLFEQDNFKNLLGLAENKCNDMGTLPFLFFFYFFFLLFDCHFTGINWCGARFSQSC